MKNFFTSLVLSLSSILPLCYADPLPHPQYVNINFGATNLFATISSNSPKVGPKAGFRYGYKFSSGLRVEGEIGYRQNHFSTKYTLEGDGKVAQKKYASFRSWAYMFNLLYDINQISIKDVVPYFGIGVGYAHNTRYDKLKYDDHSTEDKFHDDRFAYQGLAGVKYAFNETMDIGLEYQYFCGRSHAKDHSIGLMLSKNF